ncbi:MAG: type VI secretion system tip protein TssI/VgrG [Polyangiaceae bacterium]
METVMSSQDLFRFRCEDVPAETRLLAFRASEQLCRPYEVELWLSTSDMPDFDPTAAVGRPATLVGDRDDGSPPLLFHGLLMTIEHLREANGRGLYRAVLAPRLAQLGLGLHSRIFTQMTIPQILQQVLRDAGLGDADVVLRLDATYPVEEHVCQYRESDLDFVHRWLEAEGIYYFFEQHEDREVLVLTDHLGFHDALSEAPVRYRPGAGGDVTAGACFDRFSAQATARPASVTVLDYDYLNPAHALSFTAPVDGSGSGQVMMHGARFFTADKGKRLACVRAEEIAVGKQTFQASGTMMSLRVGYTFDLDEHPADRLNQRYLVVALRHAGAQATAESDVRALAGVAVNEVYRARASAIAASVQFRPARTTPSPRVVGFERGIVDGEAESQYAQLDDQGRYRIKLGFDESPLADGKASTFVRMMQPHGGGIEGWHFPLRKGTEVMLSFLGGDPDRPVISGVVPNAHTPSPVAMKNQTKNVIQTGGSNRIELDDREGGEQFTMSSPYADSYISFGSPLQGGGTQRSSFLGNDPDAGAGGGAAPDPSSPGSPMTPAPNAAASPPGPNADRPHTMVIHTNGPTLLDAGGDWDVRVGGRKDEIVQKDVREEYLANKRELVLNGQVDEEYLGQRTVVNTLQQSIFTRHDVLVKAGRHERIVGGLSQTVVGDNRQTTDGNVTQSVSGSGLVKYDGAYKLEAATSTWTIKGPEEGIVFGAQVNSYVGVRATFNISAESTVNMGPRFAFTSGLNIQLTNSTKIEIDASVKLAMAPTEIVARNTQIANTAAAFIRRAGISMTVSGAEIKN